MGSTYLSLTNKVLRRLNEVELTASDFASARGIQAVAKDAIKDAIQKINTQKFEWPFNATNGSQVLTAGTEEYTYPADLKVPDWNSFYIEKSDSLNIETTKLRHISKDHWYDAYRSLDYDSETDGRELPRYVFQTDGGGFGVTPSPDEAYTVKYRYFINTIDLETYDDTTTIPELYDYVIHEGAMHYMYMFLDNDQRAAVAEQIFNKGINTMANLLLDNAHDVRDTRVNFGGGNSGSGFYWGEY